MKSYRIEYRGHSWDSTSVIVVSADSPAEAIKKAGLKDAYEYNVSEYVPYKLANKSYSRRYGTYSAVWLNEQGEAVFWGSYNPDDGSYYLSMPGRVLASGGYGTYSFNDVRRALQLGVLI